MIIPRGAVHVNANARDGCIVKRQRLLQRPSDMQGMRAVYGESRNVRLSDVYQAEIVFEELTDLQRDANMAEACLNGFIVPRDGNEEPRLRVRLRVLGFSAVDSIFNVETPRLTIRVCENE